MSGLSSWGTFGWRLIGNFDYVLTNEDVRRCLLVIRQKILGLLTAEDAYKRYLLTVFIFTCLYMLIFFFILSPV